MLTLTQWKWSVSRSRWHHQRQGSLLPENENSRDTFISGLGTGPSVNHENSHSINNIWLIYSPASSCFLPHEEVSKQLIQQRANILFLLVQKKKQKKTKNWRVPRSGAWKLLLKILQFICQNACGTGTHLCHTSLVIPGGLGCSFVMFMQLNAPLMTHCCFAILKFISPTFIFVPCLCPISGRYSISAPQMQLCHLDCQVTPHKPRCSSRTVLNQTSASALTHRFCPLQKIGGNTKINSHKCKQ